MKLINPESITPPKTEHIAICSLRNITEAFISIVDPDYDDKIYRISYEGS